MSAIAREVAAPVAPELERFVRQRTIRLTTFRRNGTPVSTPVHIAVDGDRAYVRTWDKTGKLKRIRANPNVTIAPSSFRGAATGPPIRARAHVLAGDDDRIAAAALGRKYPFLHGWLIPRVHRWRGDTTVHVELLPYRD